MSINFYEIAALFFGVGFTWVAISKRNERLKLVTDGIQATGEVIKIDEVPSSDNSASTFKPEIRFTTQTKEVITKAVEVSTNPCPYRVGQKVPVFYDRNDVHHFVLDDGPSISIEITIFVVGIAMLLLAAFLFFSSK
jgi:hypothetical protein